MISWKFSEKSQGRVKTQILNILNHGYTFKNKSNTNRFGMTSEI